MLWCEGETSVVIQLSVVLWGQVVMTDGFDIAQDNRTYSKITSWFIVMEFRKVTPISIQNMKKNVYWK